MASPLLLVDFTKFYGVLHVKENMVGSGDCYLSFIFCFACSGPGLGIHTFWAGFDEGVLSERILSFVGGGIVVVIVLAIVFSAAPLKRLNDCWRECIN